MQNIDIDTIEELEGKGGGKGKMIKAARHSKTTAICLDCGKPHRIQRVSTGKYIKGCEPPCCVYWAEEEMAIEYNISQKEAKERIVIKRELRRAGVTYEMEEPTQSLKAKADAALIDGIGTPSTHGRRVE